jgi:hypothetical protein
LALDRADPDFDCLRFLAAYLSVLSVAEEFDDCGEADTGAQHLRSICVSKLVRDDADRNAERGGDFSQGGTQLANHLAAAAQSRQ